MSQRVKKPGRPPAEDSQGKRRRPRRPSGSEDADGDDAGTRSGSNSGGPGGGGGGNGSLTGMWTPRHLNDLKVSSIYNRNSAEAPAELYRKDLISAMKLPDSEPLTPEEYWLITDSWKQEWEKGVQVPVNPESLPEPEVKLIQPVAERSHDFRLPKKKYVRVTHDDFFNPDYHQLVSTAARAEKVCSYDLDDVDAAWLGCSNADRAMQNTTLISEFLMEQVIEELELQCWEQVQTILKSQEGLGIEYDENVICDVCRSPESEEGNEMVFCDSCNICVHQACYGITTIPSGSWLCRTCTLGIKPACVLCPNLGGAMKATRSGHTWAHVACAIWIPEVSIGSVEKMEPITKISSIPQSRWSLVCVLCKEKTGACIQCSVKTCKTAYHVTCAFKNGLEMKPIIVDENAEDGIKLRSYCEKHSVNTKNKDKMMMLHHSHPSGQGGVGHELDEQEKKKLKAMTAEERNQARADKLQQIEAEFYKYVRLKDVSQNLAVDMDVVILIYNYWKLKRKSLNNRPLVPPRPETTQLLTQQQEQDLEQMKMFVQLRQDLERVRNLCYMVSRREKLSRSFFRLKEQTFQKQLALLSEPNELSVEERQAVLAANHGPSIYDQFYSCGGIPSAPPTAGPSTSTPAAGPSGMSMKGALPDYETLISMIAGGLEAKKETLMNGIIKAAGGAGNKRQSKAAAAKEAKEMAAVAAQALAASEQTKEPLAGTSGGGGKDGEKNPYRKQFVNGARRKNAGESSQSESESESKAAGGGEKVSPAKVTPKATPSPPVKGGKKGKAAQAAAAAAAAALAAATATTPVTPEVKVKEGKAGKGASARKPLSYLFDSDSSVENALPVVPQAVKKGAKGKGAKGQKGGKAPPAAVVAAAQQKAGKVKLPPPVAGASYLSDSDELELPAATRSGGKETSDKPIYSDSEEEQEKPSGKKGGKQAAVKKEKGAPPAGKKGKQQQQKVEKEEDVKPPDTPSPTKKGRKSPAVAAVPVVVPQSPPKGKGKAGGRKGKKATGFDPTELIVPQREAAKKATESIRAVKQKGKDAQKEGEEQVAVKEEEPEKVAEVVVVAEKKKKITRQQVTSTLSESEEEEEVEEVKPQTSKQAQMTTRKGRSPERKVAQAPGGKGKRGASAAEKSEMAAAAAGASLDDEEDGDNKDEFEFDLEKEAKNVSYVPQRQAAKKAAEHIRSGLSNIVAARLIIEDEMEATRKKQKTGGNKQGEGDEGDQLSLDSAAKDKIETAVAEAAKKVTSKGQGGVAARGGGKVVLKKGEVLVGSVGGAAVSGSKDLARGGRDSADWPFLDKGSQSACRRSRERSSSSGSSSGSSGSSSSSNSSCSSSRSSSNSSSRSSSAESASPEPRNRSPPSTSAPLKPPPTPSTGAKASKASNLSQPISISSEQEPLAASASQGPGPGRKLKTSERVSAASKAPTKPSPSPPVRQTQQPASSSSAPSKPAPKGGRSAKSGARGGGDPFRSAFSPSPSPEPEPKPSTSPSPSIPSSNHDKVSPKQSKSRSEAANEKQQQQSRGGRAPPNQRSSPLSSKAGVSPASTAAAAPTTPQKKGGRRKGESSVSPSPAKSAPTSRAAAKQAQEKDSDPEEAGSASLFSPSTTTRSASNKKGSPPKALAPAGRGRGSPIKSTSLAHHTGPQLSSESETEATQPAPPPPITRKTSQSPSQKKRGRSSGGAGSSSLALSDSESEGTEEKENAQRRDSNDLHHHHHHHASHSPVVSSKSKGSTPRGGSGATPSGLPPSQMSILSPLTPTENKDKDMSRLSDTEQPESKRPRLDSTSSSTGGDRDRVGASSSASGAQGGGGGGGQHIKSIFSPTGSISGGTGGRDHSDMGYDFDSELYDLAKSVVTEEYTHGQEDGEESVGYSLHLNFTAGLFTGEDNREDSTQATLNLVKKLRQQHQQQNTGEGERGHRSSTDCMSGQEDSPNSSRPSSSLQFHRGEEESIKNSPAGGVGGEEVPPKPVRGAFAAISQMKSPSPSITSSLQSPDRTKQSIQGDERWVPPSSSTPQHLHSSSSSIPGGKVAQPLVSPYQDVSPSSHHHKSSPPSDKSHQHHHHLHLRSPPTSSSSYQPSKALSVDTLPSPSTSSISASPLVSPLLGPPPPPPTYQQHSALTAAMAEASPGGGLPFGAGFMQYRELANNPAAFASVVSSLAAAAAAAGTNHPLAPFLSQAQAAQQTTKQGPGSPATSSSYPQFIQPPPPPSSSASVTTPTPSPGGGAASSNASSSTNQTPSRSRSSDVSPLVSLATSMPSLAKPPLTSPSILLAASSNCKSVCAPPLQSAVAHIIESVVNNHQASSSSSSNLPKTTLSLDMMHLLGGPPPSQLQQQQQNTTPTSTNIPGVKTPLSSPLLAKVPQPSPITSSSPAPPKTASVAESPLSSPKFKDPQTPTSAAQPQPPPPPPPVPSGAGRGRRASTPRAAKSAGADKLSGVSAVIEDMMGPVTPATPSKGKGGRKGASPGRGKAPSTPAAKRGPSAGRGKGKGKNLVGVRKDLAGTVYDIDFDEFEEEAQEKIDLRSLRERRKSSDHHQAPPPPITTNSSLVLTLPVPPAYRQTKEEKRAQKEKEKQERDRERELAKQQKQLEKQLLKQQKLQQKLLAQQQREKERSEQKEREERESREREPLVAPLKITLNDSIRQQQQREQQQDLKEAKEREQVKSAAAAAAAAAVSAMVSTQEREKSDRDHRDREHHRPVTAAILQTPLPGPVDMRTYSSSGQQPPGGTGATMAVSSSSMGGGTVTSGGQEEKGKISEKIGFPAASKDPSSEIASLFGMPSGSGGRDEQSDTRTSSSATAGAGGASSSTVVNDFEELDKALEDLVSKPSVKPTQTTTTASSLGDLQGRGSDEKEVISVNVGGGRQSPIDNLSSYQREKPSNQTVGAALGVSGGLPGYPSGIREDASISNGSSGQNKIEERLIPQIVPTSHHQPSTLPSTSSSTADGGGGDMSRNQLKVKIKGPFLDANYAASNPTVNPPVMHPALHHHPGLHAYHHPHQIHPGANLQQGGIVPSAVPGMYPPPPHYPPHHHHQHWMMNSSSSGSGSASNSIDNNPSNLRRMRKKELLRKYWTEDGGGDGGTSSNSSNPYPPSYPNVGHHSGSHHDGMGGLPGHHGPTPHHPHHHPIGRSVITIPKAVASMSILPSTQDDHDPTGNDGMMGGDLNDPLGFNRFSDANWNVGDGLGRSGKDGGKSGGTQKKRRSRGIYREMAALGILPPDQMNQPQRNERRRDKGQGGQGGTQSPSGSTGTGSDSNSRKRMRASNKPSRSTFIPPTLAEGADSPATSSSSMPSSSSKSLSAVVNVVNHPTPKLKIKFGDHGGMTSGQGQGSSNHLSDSSDKELPNKKAKGRPPKKRGLPDPPQNSGSSASSSSTTSAAPSSGGGGGGGMSMELLKRESMKYREMIMKDYAKAEQQEILKLSGTRRGRKKKRKKGGGGAAGQTGESETDGDGDPSKSPPSTSSGATASASAEGDFFPEKGVKVAEKRGKAQPPPARKSKQVQGPYLKTLKHVHVEQIARLQAKNQHECDLLEDIRNFTKQRSTIEKSYAEALLKLSSAYLNKKIPSIPDLRDEDEEEQWNVWNVWRTVLEENEKLARARLAAVEVFQQQITDDCKNVRSAKLQTSKKCLDQLQVVQKEVQGSVSELDRFKKLYFEEEHLAHDARDKVRDVEEKLKKKKGSIFSTFTSLQRGSVKGKQAKFSSKKEACEEKSTGARNEYIISLALANAHSDRYFNVDLDGCIRTMEVDVYERLKDYLTIMGRTELLTCSAAQTSFTKIRDQAQMLSRDYNVMCCVQYYPVLKQHIRYPFDACEGDTCSKITCDHGAGMPLSREAKKWATKIGKEVKIIREQQRKLVYLIQLKEQGNKTDPDDQNGPDLETKIDEARDIIRKSETEKCKAEAVIECLRDGDVNVDEWLQDIENLTTVQDMARSASITSIKTEASSQPQAQEAFYDSDANDAVSEVYRENETSSAEPVDRDEDVEMQIEQERKRIESLNTTWEDPLKMDWGEEPEPEPPVSSPPPTAKSEASSGTGGGGGRRESWNQEDPTSGPSEPGVVKCVAIYTYEAQNPDELSIVENEHLELIGEGDGDGWVRARNYKGEEGYVPQNYVEAEAPSSATMPGYPLQPQISFSSVDYHVQDPNAVVPPGDDLDQPPQPPLDSVAEEMMMTSGQPSQKPTSIRKTSDSSMPNGFSGDHQMDEYSHQVTSEDVNVAAPATSVSSGFTTPFINELRGEGGEFCRALYDYEATGPEELSFYEGQIIRLTKRDEDDGWWEGEYDGMKGIFPCIVAEECRWDGEPLSPEMEEEDDVEFEGEEDDDVSDSGILPPSYTPPEIPSHLLPAPGGETRVIVTQPTPTVERTSPANKPVERSEKEKEAILQNGDEGEEEEFAMRMSGDNQQKYQAQFGEEEEGAEEEVVKPQVPQMPQVSIAVSDVDLPDVTISISGPEDHEGQPGEGGDSDDAGLGVVQINILAATPMTEVTPSFPGGGAEGGGEGEGDEEDEEEEVPEPVVVKVAPTEPVKKKPAAPPPPPPPPSQPVEAPSQLLEEIDAGAGFADFSAGFDDNFTDNFADAFVPPTATGGAPVKISSFEKSGSEDSATTAFEKVAFRRQSEPEDEFSEKGGGGFGGTPDDPLSSEPKVIEIIEPKEEPFIPPIFSTMGQVAKAMKQAAPPTQPPPPPPPPQPETISSTSTTTRGGGVILATNESPVTPEELDVQSLAKLESLKESDA